VTELVELRGGLIVRADAIALLLDLERRGHICSIRPEGLCVTRARELTPEDSLAIKRLRGFLLALVSYVPPEPA
jgi:hypothetical protein